MKADLLQFKASKVGTLLDEGNIEVQAKISPLELQRAKYIREMKLSKNRENETMAKLDDFTSKIRSKEVRGDANSWMNNKLKFHIDSQKAYDVNAAAKYLEKQGTGANFDNFKTGGKYAGAYENVKKMDLGEDVIQGINLEEIVSMNELLQMAHQVHEKKE